MDGVHYRIRFPNYVPPRKGLRYHKHTKQKINLKGQIHLFNFLVMERGRTVKNIKEVESSKEKSDFCKLATLSQVMLL